MPVVDHAGGGVHYTVTDVAPPWRDTPSTILFHHGLGACGDCWAGWRATLADRHRLVAFDMRGHGRSALPDGFEWSVDGMVSDLLAVADAVAAERFHLVGESIGGTVALACAAACPDRLLSLTVCNGAHLGGSIQNVESWRRIMETRGMAGWSAHMMGERFFDDALPAPKRAWYEAQQAACDSAAILDALTVLTAADLSPCLPDIAIPTLLLHPDSSPFIPVAVMADLQRKLPNAALQVFPAARHGLPFSHAEECARALRRFVEQM